VLLDGTNDELGIASPPHLPSDPKGDSMKRLTTLAATVLTLALVPLALAAGGPGKFRTKLTGTSARTEHGMLDGTWTIDLANKTSGPLNLTWNGHYQGGGTYLISGSTITLTPKKGGSCKTKAKYTLRRSGNKLTFKLIKDTCNVRRDVLTFGPWTKVG
jgi:hypothetical protein